MDGNNKKEIDGKDVDEAPKAGEEESPIVEEAPATGKAGHRERVRDRLLAEGAERASEHELLELFLFAGVPYRDTKSMAYDLLKRFGNLYGVTRASIESLLETKGMTYNAAAQLKILGGIAERYEMEKNASKSKRSVDGVLQYLQGIEEPFEEACYVVKVTKNGSVFGLDEVQKGMKNSLLIPREQVVAAALSSGSKNVVVVHNHPSGSVDASALDAAYTYALASVLRASGVNLVDHLVAFDKFIYSMKNKKLYDYSRGDE